MRPVYCVPNEAGLASEGKAVARRVARLLNALESDVNKWVVSGQIEQDIWDFKVMLLEKLRADSWQVEAKEHGGWSVKTPKEYLK